MIESFYDVLVKFFDSKMTAVHTIIPGEIVSYDGHKTRKAEVQPLIKLRTANNQIVDIQPISNVPVIFPSSDKFNLLYPLKKGDGVLLFFSECSIGNFLNKSGIVEPDSLDRFDLTDCIAIPGLWNFKNSPDKNNTTTIELEDGGDLKITGKGNVIIDGTTNIELNGNSKKFVTYTELNAALQTFITALNTHIHTTTATIGATTKVGVISPPVTPMNLDISASETQTVKTGG